MRLLCFNESKPVSCSCTCWGTIHLHFAQGESLPLSRDNHIYKATRHHASITVVCVGFTRSDVGDGGTPDSGGSWGNSYLVEVMAIHEQLWRHFTLNRKPHGSRGTLNVLSVQTW